MSAHDYDDAPGWPATATRVHRVSLQTDALAMPNRKMQLYPVRYDNRPLHLRALESRDVNHRRGNRHA